jgi:cell wall-associated NlpC family hydrolase
VTIRALLALLLVLLGGLSALAELTKDQRAKVVQDARRPEWLGIKYVEGGDYKPGGDKKQGLDCSHFVHSLYAAVSPGLPYLPVAQIQKSTRFTKVPSPVLGDLIVFTDKPLHVGVVSDPDKNLFIAQNTKKGVQEKNYKTDFYWGKRPHEFYRLK